MSVYILLGMLSFRLFLANSLYACDVLEALYVEYGILPSRKSSRRWAVSPKSLEAVKSTMKFSFTLPFFDW